jgi:AAA domain
VNPQFQVMREPFDFESVLQRAKEQAPQKPEILSFSQLPLAKPPIVIERLLRQQELLLMGGQAKRWKSWARLDLLYCVANGMPWFGFQTVKGPVIHVDLELHGASLRERLELIRESYGCQGEFNNIDLITARGKHFGQADVDMLAQDDYPLARGYSVFSLDPTYRLLGGKNENDAGVLTDLLNRFLALGLSLKASICLLQHFAKGDASQKESLDRFSGSGVWARFPDALMTFTDLETENCFSVEITLRDFPPLEPFAVRWQFPRFRIDADLDPEKLKERKSGRPKLSSTEKLCAIIGAEERISHLDLWRRAQELCVISKSTFDRRLREAKNQKLLYLSPLDGLYSLSSEYLQRNATSI